MTSSDLCVHGDGSILTMTHDRSGVPSIDAIEDTRKSIITLHPKKEGREK